MMLVLSASVITLESKPMMLQRPEWGVSYGMCFTAVPDLDLATK